MYTYKGRKVIVPASADMPRAMRPGGQYARLVQEAISGVKPWEADESPIETIEFPSYIRPMAVPLAEGAERVWGIHRGHKARYPRLSPFVEQMPSGHPVNLMTIELSGTPEQPKLVRAYGGDYIPPLPWMNSAENADGGRRFCFDFWRDHAYLSSGLRLIREGTQTNTPPDWWRR